MRNPITLLRQFSLYSIMGFILLLSGCSTVSHHNDGPPPYDVDVSLIPDAVPKAERLSKFGNPSTYKVFGRKYYVMNSSRNYEAQGIASWYGTKFHKQRTSSGERYDMLAMTAAHKNLPLPTYVQVTNLSNGKKIIVKVNDRGPFEADRLIDLSYAAAKKLGMLGHGTALVDVKAIDPLQFNKKYIMTDSFTIAKQKTVTTIHHAQKTELARKSKSRNQLVYLQVGAFKSKIYAEKLKTQLLHVITPPVIITHNTTAHLYRVQIGPIKDSATVARVNHKLKTLGLNTHTIG